MSVDRIIADILRQSKKKGDRSFRLLVKIGPRSAEVNLIKADKADGFAVFEDLKSKREFYVPFEHITGISPQWL